MREVLVCGGHIALIDDADFDLVSKRNWWMRKGYPSTSNPGKSPRQLPMHRVIMNPPSGMLVDHINGNPLDNRRENLRLCTLSENNRNVSVQSRSKSGLKGVAWYSAGNKWKVQIQANGKRTHIGYFSNKEDAHRAYCEKAKELHGEFFHE